MRGELAVILRTFARQPAFAAAAIGTLVVGIAAATALFSTINAVLLRPLPYPCPDEIYTVRTAIGDRTGSDVIDRAPGSTLRSS